MVTAAINTVIRLYIYPNRMLHPHVVGLIYAIKACLCVMLPVSRHSHSNKLSATYARKHRWNADSPAGDWVNLSGVAVLVAISPEAP